MKIRIPLPKPRNSVAPAASARVGGAHGKPAKAKRRDAKQALQVAIKQGREVFPALAVCGV
ncbi:hypothetical protein [Chitinimonas sp. BJYL2]|uniref:hypothetical protein n=1 Tax=Chitinimonas sp. BJYL2 TaxID=2976696 RepID=UPI0022B4E3AF|nr:hypothetical protein [Chitinimonas sp. BJYL2]